MTGKHSSSLTQSKPGMQLLILDVWLMWCSNIKPQGREILVLIKFQVVAAHLLKLIEQLSWVMLNRGFYIVAQLSVECVNCHPRWDNIFCRYRFNWDEYWGLLLDNVPLLNLFGSLA